MADPVVTMAPYSYTWIFALTLIFAFIDGFAIGECRAVRGLSRPCRLQLPCCLSRPCRLQLPCCLSRPCCLQLPCCLSRPCCLQLPCCL